MSTGFVIGDRGLGASGDTHPAWMMAHAEAGSYLVVGASASGQLHLARGLPRDDAFVIRSLGPWLAVAVADGVGSRRLSRYGATYVVESLTSQLLRPFAPLTKTLKREPSAGKGSAGPGRNNLAPPSTMDEATLVLTELKPPPAEKGGLLESLAAGLPWGKPKLTEPAMPSLQEVPAQEFLQVGSVGWWPSPDFVAALASQQRQGQSAPASRTSQPQTKGSMPTSKPDKDDAEDQQATLIAEPNLLPIVRQAFEKSHQGLLYHAESLGVGLEELSCTALALLFNTQTGKGAVGQVGDGAILGLTLQGKAEELVRAPDAGDPQSTYTLNRTDYARFLAVNVIEPPEVNPFVAFYIMSDGVSGDLLYSSRPVEAWAQPVNSNLLASSSPAQAAAGMLNWLSTYQVQGSWDDRTLVVITQRERRHGDRQPVAGQQESTQSTDNS